MTSTRLPQYLLPIIAITLVACEEQLVDAVVGDGAC